MGLVGKILLTVMVHVLFSNIGAPFLILIGRYAIKYMVAVKFVPQIVLLILLAFFSVMKPPKAAKPKDEAKSDDEGKPLLYPTTAEGKKLV